MELGIGSKHGIDSACAQGVYNRSDDSPVNGPDGTSIG
jgi:hypothetical protein